MADLNQMFSALQKADAAGNVEDARQIADMIRQFQRSPDPQPEFQPIPEEPGFFRALGTSAASTVKSLLPAAGLMADPASQQSAEELRKVSQEAEDAYRRTQFSDIGKLASEGDVGGALGATWSKFKELAGESIGFQAPAAGVGLAAAAAAGTVALPAAAVGVGAYGLTLLGQYIASNLTRQVEENKDKPVERLDATVAGAGSTVLDMAGGKFLGISKLLGLEGKAAADMAVKELVAAASNPIKYKREVAKGALKGVAFEIPQEVAQQALERWQAGLETNPFNDPQAAREYAEAAAGAFMLGGPLGAVGQVGARRAGRAEAAGELQRRADIEQEERKRILEGAEGAPYSEVFTGLPPEGAPIPTSAQTEMFTGLPRTEIPAPTQKSQAIYAAEQQAAQLEDIKIELERVKGILERQPQPEKIGAPSQLDQINAQLDEVNKQLRAAYKAAGITEPTAREASKAAQGEIGPSTYLRDYGDVPETPVPAALEQERLTLSQDTVDQLFGQKGIKSKRATTLYKSMLGLDLRTNEGLQKFTTLVNEAFEKNRALNYTAAEALVNEAQAFRKAEAAKAIEAPITPKTRLQEPTVLGEQPAGGAAATDLDIALMRRSLGAPLTPAQQFALKEYDAQQAATTPEIYTPETRTPQVGGMPLLQPQRRPTKRQQAATRAAEEWTPDLVTTETLDKFGISNSQAPHVQKLRNTFAALDLNQPEDIATARAALQAYRNHGLTSAKQKSKVDKAMRGLALAEQRGLFDETQAAETQGATDGRPESGVGGEGVVAPVPQRDTTGQGAAGAGPTDVARTERTVGERVGGEGREQSALSENQREINRLESMIAVAEDSIAQTDARRSRETDKRKTRQTANEQFFRANLPKLIERRDARASLESLNLPQATVNELIKTYTDNISGDIDYDGLAKFIEKEFGLNLEIQPVGATLSKTAAEAAVAGDVRKALRTISESGSTPFIRMVAKKLLGKTGNTKVIVVDELPTYGQYDPITDTIHIRSDALHEHTLIHEMVHAAISHVLRNSMHPLTKQLSELYQKVAPRLSSMYGALNVQEFASEAQSNPAFREALKSIKLPQGALKTAWDHLVNAVRKFLGWPQRGSATTLDKVDALFDKLLTAAQYEPRTPGDILFMGADVSGAAAAYKDFLNQSGAASRSLPGITPQWIDKVGGLSRGIVSAITKTLDLNHLVEIYGDKVPALRGMITLLNEKRGFENTWLDKTAQISKTAARTQAEYMKTAAGKATYAKFTDVVYDSTQNFFDPSDPNAIKTSKLTVAPKIQAAYNALPDDLKQVYKDIKNHYEDIFKYYIAGLEKDLMVLPESERKQIIDGIRSRIVPYFPLMRFGDYWLEFEKKGKDGESVRYVHAFETPEARSRFISGAKIDPKSTGFKVYTKLKDATPGKAPPSDPMIRRTLKTLREQGVDKEVIDDVYRKLLQMHPQQSAILNLIRRENVPGFEKDVLRTFTDMTPRLISQTASRLYNRNVEDTAGLARAQLQEISATDPRGYNPLAEAVARELSGEDGSRLDTILNPRMNKLASAINWMTYGYFMGGNVSTALINMTQTAMVAYPILASDPKIGPVKAFSELFKASKFYGQHAYKNGLTNFKKYGYLSPLNTMSKTDPLYKLYEELQRRGQINISISQELLDLQAARMEPGNKVLRGVNVAMSFAHQHTEMANREITAIAAYRLAKGKGLSDSAAIDYAVDVVTKSHGSGMLDTAGPIFQHPVGRVVLMFKRFAQLMMFRAARTAYIAIAGDSSLSPQEQAMAKSIARKQLIGMYAMAFAFSGAQGVPFFGLLEMFYNIFQTAFGDDDEYHDFEKVAKDALTEWGYKGPFNYLTNLDIAQRTGYGDLLIRDDSRSKAELGPLRYYMEQFFGGAPLGMLTNMNRGFSMLNEGQWYRGLEAMSPVAIRNGFKSVRFMTEGARTLKGDPITEDIGVYNSFFQLVGFAPANLSEIYAKRGYAKELEKFIKGRKTNLLDQYELAMDNGDMDVLSDVQDKIMAYNAAYPEERITAQTIKRSMDGRRRREQEAIYGVQISKKLRNRIKEEIGYED